MQFVSKDQARESKNSKTCIAYEYPMKSQAINGAVVAISGRYPDTGRVVNTVCHELGYVIAGSGSVVVEGKTVELNQGDVVLIEPNEKYYWDGNLTMLMASTPTWYPEQHQEVAV